MCVYFLIPVTHAFRKNKVLCGGIATCHNIFGHARKLGVKMHLAKSARILLLVFVKPISAVLISLKQC